MPKHLPVALLAAATLFASAALAQPPRPLFAMHAQYDFRAHGVTLQHEQFSATAQGRTVGHINRTRLGSPLGWENATFDQVAPVHAIRRLGTAFREAHVGLMPESCTTDPGLLATGRYELTWYGAGSRVRTMTIHVVSTPEQDNTCPPRVGVILAAIQTFLAEGVGAVVFDVGRSIPTEE